MSARNMALAALSFALAACEPSAPAPAAPTEPPPAAPAPVPAVPTPDPSLKAFVEAHTRDAMAPLTYVAASTGEGADQLTLIYLIGPEYCGSGGCKLLILGRNGASWTVLGEVTVVQTPIRVLKTRTNGRPDLGVGVRGGGAEGHEALLTFDGVRYPSNPTVPPARKIDQAEGTALITDDSPRIPLKQ